MAWSLESENDENEFAGNKEVPLKNGESYFADPEVYPLLMEWDWEWDKQLEQPVRIENGRRRPLYEEELRFHFRRNGLNTDEVNVLDRKAIRGTFGHLTSFRGLLAMSQKQREWAFFESGMNLPNASDILAEALSAALLMYYDWEKQNNQWAFDPDPTGITPGTFRLEEKAVRKTYTSIGQWMQNEYTGDWTKLSRAPTGIVPETYRMVVLRETMKIWRTMTYRANYGEFTIKEIEKVLKDAGRSAFLSVRKVLDTLAGYPL